MSVIDQPAPVLRARSQSRCFVCGEENRRGLHLRFEKQENGEARAKWAPDEHCEGFNGIVHGGLVSSVLDEAMSKAIACSGTEALTAELRVRFREPVSSAGVYYIRGWIVSRRRRLIHTEGQLIAPDGTEHAHAWGSFIALPH